MKKYLVVFRHANTDCERIIEAPNRDYAMACVCGFVVSCEEISG